VSSRISDIETFARLELSLIAIVSHRGLSSVNHIWKEKVLFLQGSTKRNVTFILGLRFIGSICYDCTRYLSFLTCYVETQTLRNKPSQRHPIAPTSTGHSILNHHSVTLYHHISPRRSWFEGITISSPGGSYTQRLKDSTRCYIRIGTKRLCFIHDDLGGAVLRIL